MKMSFEKCPVTLYNASSKERQLSSFNFTKIGVRNMDTFLVTPSIFNDNSKTVLFHCVITDGHMKGEFENRQHTFQYVFPVIESFTNKIYKNFERGKTGKVKALYNQ